MMSGTTRTTSLAEGTGVQVVSIAEDHTYHLNENALQNLLLRPELCELPVAVVSIAGAYRGGKSFLLDFFLRYLHAPPSSQDTTEWLGNDNDPLIGFSWSPGTERNTTGILLWSEPIITTLPSGEKVLVLLMDTQGTFDSSSTIRDNSTIFALSTLISSVQLYNLKENIKEDDLQHLQYFTDYGRLAFNDDGKAFQVLKFLVRDWPYRHEFAYGYEGGEKMLQKRLLIEDNQAQELRELREFIRSCFDSVGCYLMAHPGFTVSDPNYTGRVSDIREEFRACLLELVPSIFHPDNLRLKMINGNRLKAKDLFEYFKTYIKIFSSDELPEPMSVRKATSEAYLRLLLSELCDQYTAVMDNTCGSSQPSMSVSMLNEKHEAAVAAAQDTFTKKKKLGSQQDIDAYMGKLTEELNTRLTHYLSLNSAKTFEILSASKLAYEDVIKAVSNDGTICLHGQDLEILHSKAIDVALEYYDSNRTLPEDPFDDEERNSLLNHFAERIINWRAINKQSNISAVSECREKYEKLMRFINVGAVLTNSFLQSKHNAAVVATLELFDAKRNQPTVFDDDDYKISLLQYIDDYYNRLQQTNSGNNRTAMQTATYTYNNHMALVWGPQSGCLHPNHLDSAHEDALGLALEQFNSYKMPEDDGENELERELLDALETRFEELKNINERANQAAIDAAFTEYSHLMDKHCAPSLASVLIAPWIIKVLVLLPKQHEKSKSAALSVFRARRANSNNYDHDEHLDTLKKKITEGYDNYCNPIKALARELGIPIPS